MKSAPSLAEHDPGRPQVVDVGGDDGDDEAESNVQSQEHPQEDADMDGSGAEAPAQDGSELDDDIIVDAQVRKRFLNAYSFWWTGLTDFKRQSKPKRARLLRQYGYRAGRPAHEKKSLIARFLRARPEHKALAMAVLRADSVIDEKRSRGRTLHSAMYTWNPGVGLLWDGSASTGENLVTSNAGSLEGDSVSEASRTPGCFDAYPPDMPVPRKVRLQADAGQSQRQATDFHPERDFQDASEVAFKLRSCERVRDLWVEFERRVAHWRRELFRPFHKAAWAAELSSGQWSEDGTLRVHFHLCVVDRQGFTSPPLDELTFHGIDPVMSSLYESRGRSVGKEASSGLFYLTMGKTSSIFCASNAVPGRDFTVKNSWILNAAAHGKIACDDARSLLGDHPNGFSASVKNFEAWEQCRLETAVRKYRQWMLSNYRGMNRPWKHYPLVDVWLAQYRSIEPRYRFLVIDGPSKLGKTEFARSLVGRSRTFEISLLKGFNLDFTGYSFMKHDLVIVDEAVPEVVSQNRKLFQAGEAEISMQTSATNCHSFKVCLWGKKIVLCSNVWRESLQQMCFSDATWIQQNQFLLQLDAPMYVPDPSSLPTQED